MSRRKSSEISRIQRVRIIIIINFDLKIYTNYFDVIDISSVNNNNNNSFIKI